jgi:cyclopropane-fatty-acyl-phospholipid synthase
LATTIATANAQVQASLALLQDLARGYSPRDFAVRFWDGTSWEPAAGQEPSFTLVLNHPGALRKMFWPPRFLSLAEAYIYDDFNVEGDMVAFAGFLRHLSNLRPTLSLAQRLKMGWRLWTLPSMDRPRPTGHAAQLTGKMHSRERDLQAISYHYDTSNEFFSLFLDPRMVYTSAVYATPDDDLKTAQERKLDMVCRKLRLKPGERVLDAGCGWGGFSIFAAQHYGVQAYGVTLSKCQADWAQEQIRAAGLGNRCRVEHLDYRAVDERQPFDKIASLEMIEHIGPDQFPTFFNKCWRLLRPQGSLLIQQITLSGFYGLRPTVDFTHQYIFPDAKLTPVSFTQNEAIKVGFEVRDVENLRESYTLTLQDWIRTFEARRDDLVRATDEATYRKFKLYIAGACFGYINNVYNLHQTLVVKPNAGASGYPLSRENWYR